MGYWKTKVLPKIKKVFDTSGPKKAAAAEATKSFDESKEEYNKEFEEKKADLQPKVVEIYEASSTEIKTLVKEPKEAGLKKNSAAVQKFLDELVKIEFPGSKAVSEAHSKIGAAFVQPQVIFICEKVSTFIVTEEAVKVEERAIEEEVIKAEEAKPEEEAKADQTAETSKDKDVAVEEEKKEDITAVATVVEEKKEAEVEAPPKPAVEAAEPPKKAEEATPEQPKP